MNTEGMKAFEAYMVRAVDDIKETSKTTSTKIDGLVDDIGDIKVHHAEQFGELSGRMKGKVSWLHLGGLIVGLVSVAGALVAWM